MWMRIGIAIAVILGWLNPFGNAHAQPLTEAGIPEAMASWSEKSTGAEADYILEISEGGTPCNLAALMGHTPQQGTFYAQTAAEGAADCLTASPIRLVLELRWYRKSDDRWPVIDGDEEESALGAGTGHIVGQVDFTHTFSLDDFRLNKVHVLKFCVYDLAAAKKLRCEWSVPFLGADADHAVDPDDPF